MALLRIYKYGHPILRMDVKRIASVDHEIETLVADMIETMNDADGIGLAAPQVGKSIALCIVNNGLIDDDAEAQAYINPVIHEAGEEIVRLEEGCLSIPDIREDVDRPESIRVSYLDLNGVEHDDEVGGMLARVLQHEIDHLHGVLFVDRISPMRRKLLSKRLRKVASEGRVETENI